ncbi:MAG: ABC transporter substrate-binding protein, partial [Clostridia bacterium]|nr:ABC transporter substrate-binding protein [Clostridia bacterium]
MKKLVSLLLATLLVLCLCGTALAYSPEDPITIEFWHNRGSGAQLTTVQGQVDAFNETVGKEKGIIVKEVYIGGYADCMTKLQLSAASGEQPVVSIVGNTRISILADDDLLENMLPYAQASGVDISNFYYGMINVPYNDDTQICSFPYIKSTPVFYYNKTIAEEKGIVVPDHPTIADVEEICKKAYTVNENGEVEIWGLESLNDFTYYQGAFLWQLGEELWNEEGKSPALKGTSMLKVLSDWRRWVDEGWCRPFDSTSASDTMQQMFYQGKIFAFWASCASMKNIEKYTLEAGYELGIACLPTYDPEKPIVPIGGGNIGLVKQGNTEEQKQAGWEFLNFLFTDEMVAYNSINSGYLPTTKSVGENEEMAAYWAENPIYKVAFDQLDYGIEQAWPDFEYNSALKTDIQSVVSLLIQERSITPEEAVQQI